ncbi:MULTISPECIES: helix-turn-helix domain-containing protein [Corynebacterium]|uniref:Transcriptional regulator n=2 Tax=Corynebacterium TaxID=1716 RepID=A0A269PCR6_9CORY|nr:MULTISPECIES: helix-turn-helix transcriptional regulator [Corynebacterium]PAJ69621.1 transcriptional regulator [Corynebacterium hadale]RMD19229.1 XRE family transcriptional regulator [Corynebacterium gottingense]TVX80983.1 helix-turn-helix transcriptional regulator [Corynebacterium sp. NML180780]
MATTTLVHESPMIRPAALEGAAGRPLAPEVQEREPLLREALGMSLRAYRADKGVTLRELAKQARVSSGYLSELERGRKEVSSELLAAICTALDTSVAELLMEVVANMSLHSIQEELATTSPAAAEA